MYRGKRVVLRQLKLTDADIIMKHWNDLETRQYLKVQLPYSLEDEIEFIKKSWKNMRYGNKYTFAIETVENKKFIGVCSLENLDYKSRSATLGIVIMDKRYWNKGFGTDTMILLIAIAFKIINLNRVELDVYATNIRAKKVYEKVGFKTIGIRRQAEFVLGKYIDVYAMDILASDFDQLYPNFSFI